jgi:hypothetical protein
MPPPSPRATPLSALAVYAEPLAAGRRVAVFGDAESDLAETLVEMGARAVHVYDPDPDRARAAVERAPRGAVVHAQPFFPVDVRDGAFDLAVVGDLGLFDDPAALLARVRRLLGADGAALVASDFDYYELFDLVALQFACVRMIARVPFHGVALAELGLDDDAPDVSVDTRLAGDERAPDLFVALASQQDVRLDPYAIVQLPAPEREVHDTQEVDTAHARLAQEQLRVKLLEAQLEETRASLAEAERAAERVPPITEETTGEDPRVAALEAALAARSRELQDMAVEVEASRAATEAGRVAAAELEQVALRADEAERRLAMREHELAHAHDAHAGELVRFESALREKARAIQEHESELARRERLVHELVGALEEAHVVQTGAAASVDGGTSPASADGRATSDDDPIARENDRLRAKLDKLALDLARREGEAQASAWAITELEQRLGDLRGAPAPRVAVRPPELDQALDQIDVLKKALAQEHEELARARAEVQRQSALLDQLRPKEAHSPEPGA